MQMQQQQQRLGQPGPPGREPPYYNQARQGSPGAMPLPLPSDSCRQGSMGTHTGRLPAARMQMQGGLQQQHAPMDLVGMSAYQAPHMTTANSLVDRQQQQQQQGMFDAFSGAGEQRIVCAWFSTLKEGPSIALLSSPPCTCTCLTLPHPYPPAPSILCPFLFYPAPCHGLSVLFCSSTLMPRPC